MPTRGGSIEEERDDSERERLLLHSTEGFHEGSIDISMPKPRLMYIELKTGQNDRGPAWIARVTFSKSGRSLYFNGMALKRTARPGVAGNHYDLETGDEYWVSGVKKDGQDRHWAGSGKVNIDAAAVEDYLALMGLTKLDQSRFVISTIHAQVDIQRLSDLENKRL